MYVATYRLRGGIGQRDAGFAVIALGNGVYRLLPLQVEITSPPRDNLFVPGEPIHITAEAGGSVRARVVRVEFLIDARLVAVDSEPPYGFNWHGAEAGRHVATARVHNTLGDSVLSAPRSIFVGMHALERSIARSEDDAEQRKDGSMYLSSSDLEFVEDGGDQLVGLRFTNIRVPRGAQIRKAYLQFTADEATAEPTDLIIHAQLAGNAETFTDVTHNISSRRLTSAAVDWSPKPWTVVGERAERQRTPDLAGLIQEVIDRPEWREGNALVFIVSGSGTRVAESYDYGGVRGRGPLLHIEIAPPGL